MARDYNQQNPDGSWWHVSQDNNGNFTHTVIPDPTGPGPSAQTYNTPNGPKTIAEMRQGLQGAGYNGPQDDASIIAKYNETASGAGIKDTTTTGSGQKLLDAIASGDREKLDEAIREFNVTAGQTDRKQYGDLASTLLSTASQLRGPKDYYQFQKYTSGGRDLMDLMNGNTPRADFSAPTGPIEPFTIQDLMAKLGLTAPPGAGGTAGGTGTAGTYQTVNGPRTIDQMFAELRSAGWGGQQTDVAGIIAAYQHTTGNPVTPATGAATVSTTTPQAGTQLQPQAQTAAVAPQMAQAAVTPPATTPNVITPLSALRSAVGGDNGVTPRLQPGLAPVPAVGITGQPLPTVAPGATGDEPRAPIVPGTNAPPAPGQPVNPATTDPTKQPVKLPYQWNPAVWDSLGSVGQGLIQSLAESQGWDFSEYLRQLNASRPVGNAPAASVTQFASPTSAFSGAR